MGRARRNQRDAQRKQRAAKRRKNVKDVDEQHWTNHEDDDDDNVSYYEHATTTTTTTTSSGEQTVLLRDPLPANQHDTSDNVTAATSQTQAHHAVGSEKEAEAYSTSTNPSLSKNSVLGASIPSGLSPIERLRAKKQWRKQRQKAKQEAKKKELSLLRNNNKKQET